jgi:DNA invertase Pin-like site-specific DNA recombinase
VTDYDISKQSKSLGVCLYARVSTPRQGERHTVQNQLADLREFAKTKGLSVAAEYVDEGVSGSKESRPQLDSMMVHLREGRYESVVVWSYDRFARSVRHLVAVLEEFRELGVGFLSLQQGIDTRTPAGRFAFHIFASGAEFEREMIRERIFAGLRRVKAMGKKLGRHPKHGERTPEVIKEILRLRLQGRSLAQISGAVDLSRSRVSQILAEQNRVTESRMTG